MKIAHKGKLSLALLASVGMAVTAAPTYAQSTGVAALDTIVVTAQKREENLQDVPLAVSAISADKIEQLDIDSAQDISGLAPNVTVTGGTTSLGAAIVSIRGINSPAVETFGIDTANGVYVDGVYIARSAANGLDTLDLERVEVLRGPQGTLFGRNTTGGAISFISKSPSADAGVKAEVGFGNYNSKHAKVTLNTGNFGRDGETAGLKTSLSYSHRERDGVVDNILERSRNDPGARNSDSLRFATKLDFDDTASLRYIADWSNVKGRAAAFQLTNAANAGLRPALDVNGTLVTQTQQQGSPLGFISQANFLRADCAALSAPLRDERRDEICLDQDADATEKVLGHNLVFEKDFGNVQLKTTTGYRDWESIVGSSDLDGLGTYESAIFSNATLFNGMPESLLQFIPSIPAAFRGFIANSPIPTTTQGGFDTNNVREHTQFSQEIELSGGSDNLEWVVGGFYFKEDGSERNPQNSGFVLDTNNIFLANFGPLGPGFAAANPAQFRTVVTEAILDYEAESESKAVYGQFTFRPSGLNERLSLTAGGRYTEDEKELRKFQDGTAPLAQVNTGEADFNKFTWNVMAGYDVSEEINLYARVATGYRSGGFNASDQPAAGSTVIGGFDEESVTSYEAGFKSELFDNRVRLNAAAYYNDFKDLAVVQPVNDPDSGTFGTRFANAGSVEYLGFEVEGQAVITDNFSIDGNLGYIDINYKELLAGTPVTGTQPVDIADFAVPQYTSPLTYNIAANWQQSLNWRGSQLKARVGYTHEDGKYSFLSSIASPFNEEIRGDDRDIVDAQLGIHNIDFGGTKANIKVWGKNLTDAEDFVRGVDFGPLGYAGGYFADPRTYGVTLGIEY